MFNEICSKYKGTAAGTAIGIVLGTVYLFFGFWDMMVFAFIVFVGFYLGSKIDQQGQITMDGSNIFKWLTERWKMFR